MIDHHKLDLLALGLKEIGVGLADRTEIMAELTDMVERETHLRRIVWGFRVLAAQANKAVYHPSTTLAMLEYAEHTVWSTLSEKVRADIGEKP